MYMSSKTFRFLAAALLIAAALTSCKSEYEALLNSNDVDAKYNAEIGRASCRERV